MQNNLDRIRHDKPVDERYIKPIWHWYTHLGPYAIHKVLEGGIFQNVDTYNALKHHYFANKSADFQGKYGLGLLGVLFGEEVAIDWHNFEGPQKEIED